MCLTNLKVEAVITPVIALTASYSNPSWRIDIGSETMAVSNDDTEAENRPHLLECPQYRRI